MKTSNLFRGLLIAAFALIAVGCVTQSDHPFAPGTGESIPVPPGALILAFGHYPIGQFTIPQGAGQVYVWDVDARNVALLTTATPGTTVTDLNQLSKNSFEPTHSYRVYFIPAAQVITTQPAVVQ